MRVGKNYSNKLLVSPYRVDLSLVISVLYCSHPRFGAAHRFLIALLDALRLRPLGLYLISRVYLHIDSFFLHRRMVFSLKSFHFRVEAARHPQLLLGVHLL
jgi:hypothetical protein